MWKTVALLIFTLIVVPLLAIAFEPPLPDNSQAVLRILVLVYVFVALLCFIVSTIARNYSQVDKLWSIMPIIYAWIAAVHFSFEPRITLMAVLATVWGLRLTANFARRGGYSWRFWEGEEDYRWAEVRKRPGFSNPWAWSFFNLVFISFYQMGLILLFTLPIVKSHGGAHVGTNEGMELGLFDFALSGLLLILVYLQNKADNQQWVFQSEKYRLLESGETVPIEYTRGFVRTGLWGLVRHPNYACEQAIWIVFYLFSVVATGQWLNWSVMGVLLLVILFRSSSQLSEEISAQKYPDYAEYQKQVPRFIPLKFRP